MKFFKLKSIYLACLLVCAIVCHGQEKKTIISGSINLDTAYVMVVSDLLNKHSSEEVALNKEGRFQWQTEISTPKWLEVFFMPKKKDRQLGASFPLYVKPGDRLNIKLNYSLETYLQLLSTTEMKNDNKGLIEYAGFSNRMMRDLFMKGKENVEFGKTIEQYLHQADKLIDQYKLKQKDIVSYMKLWSYNNYLGVAMTNSKITIPQSILDAIPSIFDTELTLSFYNGPVNVNNYINALIPMESDPFKRLEFKNAKLNELFKNKSLISSVIEGDLQRYVTSYKVVDLGQFASDVNRMEALVNTIADDRLQKTVLQDFKNLRNTSLGSAAPNVKFKDLSGKEVSLEQFKGKYIYIDLWASWCVPCIKEIPFLHEIEKEFAGKNIVFVSISLDDNKTAWRNKVAELKLEGHQWELGESSYDKLMNVNGIPHFILYNPEGKLMQYKAPRPSSKELRNLLKSLI